MALFSSKEITAGNTSSVATCPAGNGGASLFVLPSQKAAAEVVKQLELNDLVYYFSKGKFSSHELMRAMLDYTGPAKVYISSFTISEDPARQIQQLKQTGVILELHCLVDHKVVQYCRGAYPLLKKTADSIRLEANHSKLIAIKNELHTLTAICTSNFNKNKRREAGHVTKNPAVNAFYINQILKG